MLIYNYILANFVLLVCIDYMKMTVSNNRMITTNTTVNNNTVTVNTSSIATTTTSTKTVHSANIATQVKTTGIHNLLLYTV